MDLLLSFLLGILEQVSFLLVVPVSRYKVGFSYLISRKKFHEPSCIHSVAARKAAATVSEQRFLTGLLNFSMRINTKQAWNARKKPTIFIFYFHFSFFEGLQLPLCHWIEFRLKCLFYLSFGRTKSQVDGENGRGKAGGLVLLSKQGLSFLYFLQWQSRHLTMILKLLNKGMRKETTICVNCMRTRLSFIQFLSDH